MGPVLQRPLMSPRGVALPMHHGHHDHEAEDDWDDRAEEYNRSVDLMEPELAKATHALLDAARVHSGSRVLDVACGPGHTTAAATALGAHATGIDASPAMIAIAKERFPNSSFAVGNMEDPPKGPWDAVVCRLGAHHADPRWLAAVRRVLRPGGRLAIAETDAKDEESRARHMRSPSEWARILENAGYGDIEAADSGADFSRAAEAVRDSGPPDDHGVGPHFAPQGPIYVIAGTRPPE